MTPLASRNERFIDLFGNLRKFGTYSQKQIEGGSIGFPSLAFDLSNASKELNYILTDSTWNGIGSELQYTFDNLERITKFKGAIDNIAFSSDKEPMAQLIFQTKLASQLKQKVSGTYSSLVPPDYIPLVLMVENIIQNNLTPSNPDMDHASWSDWKQSTSSDGVRLIPDFTGGIEAIDVLKRVSEFHDVLIWGELDGKLTFSYYPDSTPTPVYTFLDSNAHYDRARLTRNMTKIINRFVVWYATTPGSWIASQTAEDKVSQLRYGLKEKVMKDQVMFAWNSAAAQTIADRLLVHYATPPLSITFKAGRGTQAFLLQLGDIVGITWDQVGFTDKLFRIYGISCDLNKLVYTITAEEWFSA